MPETTTSVSESRAAVSDRGQESTSTGSTSERKSVLGAASSSAASSSAASNAADWRSALPEDIRSDPTLESIKDVVSLAKGYVHAQRMLGGKLVMPGKDADEKAWSDFYEKLGKPRSPEDYGLEKLSETGGYSELNSEDLKRFSQVAHKAHLNTKQVSLLLSWYVDLARQARSDMEASVDQEYQEAVRALRREYGNAFDAKIQLATSVVNQIGGEPLMRALKETGASSNPEVVKALVKIGGMLGEGRFFGGGSTTQALSPSEAQDRIRAKRLDGEFHKAWVDPRHPGHERAVEEMKALYDQAYPKVT